MLFFLGESWFRVGPARIGAIGGIGIREASHNHFYRDFLQLKRRALGAKGLGEGELTGAKCFSKQQFREREEGGEAQMLTAAEMVLNQLDRYRARVFVVWTEEERGLLTRNPEPLKLQWQYVQLLADMYEWMEREAPRRRGQLIFRHHGPKLDEAIAYHVAHYLRRGRRDWIGRFSHLQLFAPSPLTPAVQAADLILYLAPWLSEPSRRPELQPYLERIEAMAFEFKRAGPHDIVRTLRKVR